jgi:hypothetical protein
MMLDGMMNMDQDSIAILGIDAADYSLAKKWGCDNILLENNSEIDTFSYSHDFPATMEVWPSIATGLSPQEHGITIDPASNRESIVMKLAIKANQLMPSSISSSVVAAKENIFGSSSPVTTSDHIFSDGGAVLNWPGVTECIDYNNAAVWFKKFKENRLSEGEFYNKVIGNAGRGMGWLASQSISNVPIFGVHIHMLDYMGHIYAKRPALLKKAYLDIDMLISRLLDRVDELLIISDHGMQTTELDDPHPGVHSTRALISSTMSDELPGSVLEVRDWLEGRKPDILSSHSFSEIDAPESHLRDLGYL